MVSWKAIPEYLYGRWGNDEKGFRNFVTTFGFDRYARVGSTSIVDPGKFLRCDRGYDTNWRCKSCDVPPGLDHAMAFHRSGTKRRLLVCHPYIPNHIAAAPHEYEQILETWCYSRDIIYVFCPKVLSFYNPGATYMVLLMSENTYVDCLSVPGFPQNFEM